MNFRVCAAMLCSLMILTACSDPEEQAGKHHQSKGSELVKTIANHVNPTVRLDKRLVLVQVAGLDHKKMSMSALTAKYFEPHLIDLRTGQEVNNAPLLAHYDLEKILADPTQSVTLNEADDPAGIRQRENTGLAYLVKNDAGQYSKIVLPIRGMSRFSIVFGYLALDIHTLKIAGLGFYQHAETPGLGATITEKPQWAHSFVGKQVFSHDEPDFQVVIKHRRPTDDHSVDGISGASYTSRGVRNAINYWCGDKAYGPFIHKVAANK
ncbi:NADH:ubiquinone reductase (Na(+)-transporting) subunit C [Vibrio quintilis]|nr:NADH:ubiquinone reductase (Na(+)-transporting) subunit C [Vibrio quintilis]